MEIQQAPAYASFIASLGWIVVRLDAGNLFIKPFPFVGALAKLQRTQTLPGKTELLPILKKYRIKTLAVEPDASVSQKILDGWVNRMRPHVRINTDFFLPTKTVRVDLTASEADMFKRFSEAKRRAVRRAEKNGISVSVSDDIGTFLSLKNRTAGLFGFITTAGARKLWDAFPGRTAVLLAYRNRETRPLAGIFLIYHGGIAYYWIAGSLKSGKKLFAPTLLVWEALKQSKQAGCKALDFVGVWDERMPARNREWLGFTKFKEGFGGTEYYYPYVR